LIWYISVLKTTNYPQDWWGGFFCLALSGFLFFYSLEKKIEPQDLTESGPFVPAQESTGPLERAKFYWFGVLASMAASILAFRNNDLVLGSVIALALLSIVLWIRFKQGFKPGLRAEFDFSEKKWFWTIMVSVVVLRLVVAGTNLTGLQGDEGNNLTDSLGVFPKGPFVTAWGGTPTFPYYFFIAFFKLFGVKIFVARLVSITASAVAMWFFYHWCRFWLSPLSSILALFWLGVSWWYFFFSLSPFHNSILIMTMLGAFYFLEKGFRSGERAYFWWSGVFAAACVMNYVSGRSVPLMLFLMVGFCSLFRGFKFLKIYWKGLALSCIGFFWLATPFLIYAARNPNEVWGRVQPGWIAQEAQHSGNYFFLLKSYAWTLVSLWTLNIRVDSRFITQGLAFLDPVTGAFALLGFGLMILNFRKPIAWALAPGLFFGLSASALARLEWPTDLAYVQGVRLSIVIPFVFLMAGWGLDWCLKYYRGFRPNGWGWTGLLTVVAILGSAALNEPIFLSRFSGEPATWGEHGFAQMELSKVLKANAATHQFAVDPDAYSNAVVFAIRDVAPRPFDLNLNKDIPLLYSATKDVMLFFSPWRITEDQKRGLRRYYPHAVWKEYPTPWHDIYLISVDIPLAEFTAAQKGKKLLGSLP
jgi:hypothetical protein